MLYFFFYIKRYIEQLLMFPFIVIGKWKAKNNPLSEEYDLFFFFPVYDIGGAEMVNAEIVRSFPEKRILIFFTKKSSNAGMKHLFLAPNVTFVEISKWTDNKRRYWNGFIYRGMCSTYINAQKKHPVVFIGQCNFGYKVTPHISRTIKIYELIHVLDKKFTWVWAPFIKFIDARIVLAEYFRKAYTEYYSQLGIPFKYSRRIVVILNCLSTLPNEFFRRSFSFPLRLYYAGRGGPQKRIDLILRIFEACQQRNLPVTLKMAGSFRKELPETLLTDNTYVGEIKGGADMLNFHRQNDVLLMTSAWEGFPMVMMESMANGGIVVTTPVDAIPEFISDTVNGFLLVESKDENLVIADAVSKIAYLCEHPEILNQVSYASYQYIRETFSKENFVSNYRKLLLS